MVAGDDIHRYKVAAAPLTSFVGTAAELGQTQGPSLLKPIESFNFRLYSRYCAILFSCQPICPSSVRGPTAVTRVGGDGLVGHGGELPHGACWAPPRVLVLV